MLQIYSLHPLGLGGTRGGAEQLVEEGAGHVAQTLHGLAASKLLHEVFGELANIAILAREDVNGCTTANDVVDFELLVVIAVPSTAVKYCFSN